jgi:purine-binding chemotaxis protein CheW
MRPEYVVDVPLTAAPRSPQQTKAVLAARALQLARRPAPARSILATLDLLVFELGAERYAIEVRHVLEVVRAGALTPIPGTSHFVLGVTNLRGGLVAVVDLGRVLGMTAAEVTPMSPLLILGDERVQFGALIHAVHDVTTVLTQSVMDVSAPSPETTRDHFRGVTREGVVILYGDSSVLTHEAMDSSAPSTEPAQGYLRGVTREGVVILNGDSLLADVRLVPEGMDASAR